MTRARCPSCRKLSKLPDAATPAASSPKRMRLLGSIVGFRREAPAIRDFFAALSAFNGDLEKR